MIQEIIILSNTGIPLFNHTLDGTFNEKYDYRLIASYFDQICRFTKYRFSESLVTLKLNKSEFYFYTHPEKLCHLIVKVDDKNTKKKSMDRLAQEIFNKFTAKFRRYLVDFNGNINIFKSFSNDLEELLKSKGIRSLLSNFL